MLNYTLGIFSVFLPLWHRLHMEVDLQSLFGLHVTWCAQLYSLAETPLLSPSPRIWTRITRALLVSKDRRHLFVTPYSMVSTSLCSQIRKRRLSWPYSTQACSRLSFGWNVTVGFRFNANTVNRKKGVSCIRIQWVFFKIITSKKEVWTLKFNVETGEEEYPSLLVDCLRYQWHH